MRPEIANWTEALSTQLALLHELASELEASRKAYVAMDCDAIYRHTAAQAELCGRLRAAGETRAQVLQAVCASLGLPQSVDDPHRVATHAGAAAGTRVRMLLAELAQAERDVRRLNTEQTVLIGGSQRTLHVLGNAFARFSTIYSPPRHFQTFAHDRIPQ